MALSDALWDSARDIEYYRASGNYDDMIPEIENMLCDMLAMALDLDSLHSVENNEFHKALRNKDYTEYLRLSKDHAEEFEELRALHKVGLVETWQILVAKYYGYVKTLADE